MNFVMRFFEYLAGSFSDCTSTVAGMIEKKIQGLFLSGVDILRTIFANLFILILSLFLLFIGFAMLPLSVLVYAPWDNSTRLTAGIAIAIVYMLLGVLIYLWMFNEARWKRIFMRQRKERQ